MDLSRGGNGVAREETELKSGDPADSSHEAQGSSPASVRRVVFLPLSLPGDVVTARIVSEEKRFANAEIVEIETPSPDRVKAPCAVFGKCGGCTWQHVPYAMQWNTKRDGVLHALARAGVSITEGSIPVREFPATSAYSYRNRIQLRANLQMENGVEKVTLGYYARKSKDLVNIERCEIAREELNAILLETRAESTIRLRNRRPVKDRLPELKVEIDVLPDGSTRKAWDSPHAALGFRQVNDEQNDRLRGYVTENLSAKAHIFDLFGGAGNFTLKDSRRYAWVECVDTGTPENGIDGQPSNFRFFRSDVSKWLSRREKENRQGDFIAQGPIEAVLDPPRGGLADGANRMAESLDALEVTKIIAVGCDADSWARDLSRLLAQDWKLKEVAVFDLFPQTPHVESVAVLVRV